MRCCPLKPTYWKSRGACMTNFGSPWQKNWKARRLIRAKCRAIIPHDLEKAGKKSLTSYPLFFSRHVPVVRQAHHTIVYNSPPDRSAFTSSGVFSVTSTIIPSCFFRLHPSKFIDCPDQDMPQDNLQPWFFLYALDKQTETEQSLSLRQITVPGLLKHWAHPAKMTFKRLQTKPVNVSPRNLRQRHSLSWKTERK